MLEFGVIENFTSFRVTGFKTNPAGFDTASTLSDMPH